MKIKKVNVKHLSEVDFKFHEHEMDEHLFVIAEKIREIFNSNLPWVVNHEGNKIFVSIENPDAEVTRTEREYGYGTYRITIESLADIRVNNN